MKTAEKIDTIDTQEHRNRLLATLTTHIGLTHAIGMAALFEAVFDRPWDNRINDTRAVRRLITVMREEGVDAAWDNLTPWERVFIENLLERFRRYGRKITISPKEWTIITQISEKIV